MKSLSFKRQRARPSKIVDVLRIRPWRKVHLTTFIVGLKRFKKVLEKIQLMVELFINYFSDKLLENEPKGWTEEED